MLPKLPLRAGYTKFLFADMSTEAAAMNPEAHADLSDRLRSGNSLNRAQDSLVILFVLRYLGSRVCEAAYLMDSS